MLITVLKYYLPLLQYSVACIDIIKLYILFRCTIVIIIVLGRKHYESLIIDEQLLIWFVQKIQTAWYKMVQTAWYFVQTKLITFIVKLIEWTFERIFSGKSFDLTDIL